MLKFSMVDTLHDRDALASWLAGQEWPFHANRRLTPEQVHAFIDEGVFGAPESALFWISTGEDQKVGLLRVFDLDEEGEDAPRFDLRISEAYRNKKIGREAVRWMTDYLFRNWPSLQRIEGTTRHDNFAMQRVFLSSGFVKEGHLRGAWQSADGSRHDTLLYAIIRRDWLSGSSTPVPGCSDESVEGRMMRWR